MSEDRDKSGTPSAREAREARLAAALRANLRRRKAAPSETPVEPPGSDTAATDEPSEHD